MSDRDKVILEKMIKYCVDSTKYIKDQDYDTFSSNELVLTFSVFSLSQLGELVTKLNDDVKANHNQIPWNDIKNMRNRIVHDYEGVQFRIVWDTLVNDIPLLTDQLRNIRDK